jgi:transcriptional regulator with XRE-family HTH domain
VHPIERARRAKGLTQAQLAERVGVHINTAQAWEKGAQPRPKQLPKIAEVLETDAGLLLDQLVNFEPPAAGRN